MKEFRKQYKYYTPPFIWAIIIFGLCTMSRNALPNIDDVLKLVFDKLVHLIMYVTLTLLLIVSFIKQSTSYLLKHYCFGFAVGISAIYGVFIEFYQAFMTVNRSGDYQDVIANVSGSFIGVLAFYLVYGKPKNYI